MGSRFAALELSERLRPWHQLGVRFLWGGAGARALGQSSQASPDIPDDTGPDRAAVRPAPQQAARPARPAAQPAPSPSSSSSSTRPRASASEAQPSQADFASPALAAQSQGRAEAGQGPWPAPWDGYMQRGRPAAQVVFTYWDLAQDLGDAADAARRDVWKRLLAKLAWPAGTVSFWPVCAAEGRTLLAKPALFWRGVAELGAGTVAVFGKRAHLTLFPDRPYRCKPFRLGGTHVLVLPGPADLVAGNVQAMRLVWESLRGLSLA